MCRVCVKIAGPIKTTLHADNLRSEARWERQVLEALIHCDWTTKVYSLYPQLKNVRLGDKFVDGLPIDECADTILLYQDCPRADVFCGKFKGFIVNTIGTWSDPAVNAYRERLKEQYGNYFFHTFGYYWPSNLDLMKTHMGDVEFLPLPGIPEILELSDPFDRNIILWNRRGVVGYMNNRMQPSFEWVAKKLEENPEMEFHIFTGEENYSVVNRNLLFSTSGKCLSGFSNRVYLHANLGWDQVQEFYGKTKIVISPPGFCFENGDIEAAGAGVPTVFHTTIAGPPGSMNAVWDSEEYYNILDKLFYDRDFYSEKSKAYRDFVEKNHTYKAFTNNLYSILEKRQLI